MASRSIIASIFGVSVGLAAATIAQAQSPQYGPVADDAVSVSLVELIATGAKFDGKIVRVDGVIHLEFEGNALYLSKEHQSHGITKNSVWISPDFARLGADAKTLSKLNGRYVLIEGRFNSKNNGHFGMFSGAIENVSRVMSLEK